MVPFDFPGRVTAEQQAASLHQALAGWDRILADVAVRLWLADLES